MMQKILKIAQREYIETVKTKTFIISILITPVIIGVVIYFSHRISEGKTGPRPPIKVAVTDFSEQLSQDIEVSFSTYNEKNPNRQILFQKLKAREDPNQAEQQGKTKLRRDQINAYVILDKDILQGPGKIRLYTHKTKPSNLGALWTIENLINKTVFNQRCKLEDLSPELLNELRNVPIERVEIGSAEDQEHLQSQTQRVVGMMVPLFFMYLIFMGIVGTGQHMLSSIIEEKNSRIIEVLLSAVSPFQLMAGKIFGLAGIGLTVMSLWAVAAYGAAQWQSLNVDVPPGLSLYFIIYYILGFLLFTSILSGIGSICNTIKETQSLMMPIMMVFIIPLIGWYNLVQSPDGTLARVLSFVPPLTPMVMILRLSSGSEVWFVEILASIALLAVSVMVAMWLAAKVFRTGILMYGKRPGMREVLRWLKQK